MNAHAHVVPRLPHHTEHGESYTANVVLSASPKRVWRVLSSVAGWPTWNPFVEWTSAQILKESEVFTVLSARTLLECEMVSFNPGRSAHLRFCTAARPQPPAADWSIALMPQGLGTAVVAQLSIEPWFLYAIKSHIDMRNHTPVTMFLDALNVIASR